MKYIAALLATLAFAAPATAALPVGAKAPDFTTQAALGGKHFTFALKSALKKGPVVLYFFPAAFTKGCTIEAHEFALASAEFTKNGATLIGLSADPIDKLAQFSTVECREAFPVGVATPGTIKGYNVVLPQLEGRSDRTSYVIAPDGKVIYALSQANPNGHVEGTMGAVKAWRAKHRKA
jgi:peroxiredoxin